ncbi:MAG: rod shape-determining protein RodA [Paracoccaceae bacterium]|nr:rod shape-determining protein RodA [Paracoccaceae bacterium]
MISSKNPYHEIPNGFRKLFYLNWPVLLLVITTANFGFLILYSVADGNLKPWAQPQIIRFIIGVFVIFIFSFININFWKKVSFYTYLLSLLLLVLVLYFGVSGGGAQRWLDLKFITLQPSELVKISLIMLLAAYYDWLKPERTSHMFWVALPAIIILVPSLLVIIQPDLGTGLLITFIGISTMFLAGVSWWYFVAIFGLIPGMVTTIWISRGKSWQFLTNYQYRRIDTFLDPSLDPLGSGYHITQSKIALGSGGFTGRGFMQGTQSQLDFLPRNHTDFIFTTLAEEFGFLGAISLLMIYGLIIIFSMVSAITNKSRFGYLLTAGLTMNFFSYFAINIAMVMGLAPVVGVPLPLISYGGSAMLVLLAGFGLMQSAHVHRIRHKY